MRAYSTKGMTTPPRFSELFRVGPQVGVCILRTPWFVVMVKGWNE